MADGQREVKTLAHGFQASARPNQYRSAASFPVELAGRNGEERRKAFPRCAAERALAVFLISSGRCDLGP
jgi:hypothetical protein